MNDTKTLTDKDRKHALMHLSDAIAEAGKRRGLVAIPLVMIVGGMDFSEVPPTTARALEGALLAEAAALGRFASAAEGDSVVLEAELAKCAGHHA
jgi:hypothetical protein